MKKMMEICDACQETKVDTLATGKCFLCGKALCREHLFHPGLTVSDASPHLCPYCHEEIKQKIRIPAIYEKARDTLRQTMELLIREMMATRVKTELVILGDIEKKVVEIEG